MSLNQATAVDTWLRRNEEFTNEFILDWVKDHPELHLALFQSNPYFDIPDALSELVDNDPTYSKDSGVDIGQGSSNIRSQSSVLEDRLLSLEITASHKKPKQNREFAIGHSGKQKMEIHPEIRADRLEAMLDMSRFLHAKIFVPLEVVMKVMHSAQHFLNCTVVHLLLNECQPILDFEAGGDIVELSKALVVSNKYDDYVPRKVDEKYVPHLIELTKRTQQLGSTFEMDDKIICVCLRGAWGMTIGFLVLVYSDEEIRNVTKFDLTYIDYFSQICGMAIDNACTISNTTRKLCNIDDQVEEEQIPSQDSRESIVWSNDTDNSDYNEEEMLEINYSCSCPELSTDH